MSKENLTRLSIDVPSNLHKVLKFHVLQHETNIKEYVLKMIESDLSEELEDYLLAKEIEESKKAGSLSVDQSEDFLKKIKKDL